METMDLIFTICAVCAYCTLLIAISFRLHLIQKEIKKLHKVSTESFVIVSIMKLQNQFDEINKLKEVLRKLVVAEEFEEAKKIQATIEELQKDALECLQLFQENFGNIAKVELEHISINKDRA